MALQTFGTDYIIIKTILNNETRFYKSRLLILTEFAKLNDCDSRLYISMSSFRGTFNQVSESPGLLLIDRHHLATDLAPSVES